MAAIRQSIPVSEVWGIQTWDDYDIYTAQTTVSDLGRTPSTSYPFGLDTQRHIDVRTFNTPWTGGGTYAPIPALNHWSGLTIALVAGTTTLTKSDTAMDLTTLGSNTQLVLTLPLFPLANIDLTNSYLDLSSDGFSAAICALKWSNSTSAPTSGPTALTWPYSALTGLDLTKVTGVRLRIAATGSCTFYALGVRLLDNAWIPTNIDFDNRNKRLRPTIPLNGDPTVTAPANQMIPQTFRSAAIASVDDPRPINGDIGFFFNTGSQTANSSFTVTMREANTAFITQLDLAAETQADLTGQPQPTQGVSEFAPRPVSDLDRFTIGELEGRTMFDLASINDPVFTSWIAFGIGWGVAPFVQIINSSQPTGGYIFNATSAPTFANNTTYLAICSLRNNMVQVQIYNVNQTTLALGTLLFDTTQITDSYAFPRRKGRVGWQASIADGDSYIGAIRPRRLMFAEYRSAVFNSLTPVQAARLYAKSTPDVELFTGWSGHTDAGNLTPTLTADSHHVNSTATGHTSTAVTVTQASAAAPGQGVVSNWLTPNGDGLSGITNLDNLIIECDIWIPSALVNNFRSPGILSAALVSDTGASFSLSLPLLTGNSWNHVKIQPPLMQAGLYQLLLYYNGTLPGTFWIDNTSVRERAVRWSARSVASDPWMSNYAPWTDFHEAFNDDHSNVIFNTFGTQLQMRAQALSQDAAILDAPKLVPQYAQLGRLVWPENAPNLPVQPTAAITATNVGRTYTFNGTTSTSPNGLTNWFWSFGDGNFGSGAIVTYTYPVAGTYTVNLTVTDAYGLTALATVSESVA